MMKGSTGAQAAGPQNTGPQNTGQQNSSPWMMGGLAGRGVKSPQSVSPLLNMLSSYFPQYLRTFGSGTGTKGSMQPQPQEQSAAVPATQAYTNYQQMPSFSSQPAAPSDALTRFMSGYASGGNVKNDDSANIEDDIKAALRIARLIGELTKKE